VKYLLAAENVDVLAQFGWSKGVLAFDYDGTLAPITTDRHRALMSASTRAWLEKACRLYPCAVISGRGSREISRLLGDIPIRHIHGNHGMEPGHGLDGFKQIVSGARRRLEIALSGQPGIEIEDKTYSLSIHYRRSRQRTQARLGIERAIEQLSVAVRTIPGKCVVNLLPKQAKTKGDALLAIRDEEQADTALYFGDDDTDEDVFCLNEPGRLTTVRIGYSADSAASYYLREQIEMDQVLQRLVAARSKAQGL
jgi:trehalose 6-phosphate phosphatase